MNVILTILQCRRLNLSAQEGWLESRWTKAGVTFPSPVAQEAPKNLRIFYLHVLQQHKRCWSALVYWIICSYHFENSHIQSTWFSYNLLHGTGWRWALLTMRMRVYLWLSMEYVALSNAGIEGYKCVEISSAWTSSIGPATKKPRLSTILNVVKKVRKA